MIKRLTKVGVFLLIIVLISVSSFLFGYHSYLIGFPLFTSKNAALQTIINEATGIVSKKYVEPVEKDKLTGGAIKGIVDSLNDPFAQYLDMKDYKGFKHAISGTYSGIGVYIEGKKREVFITKVMEESPAQEEGLKKGDQILKIDSIDTSKITIEQSASKIRGKAETVVRLVIKRQDKVLNFNVTRKDIDFPNIITKVKKPGIGYVMVHSFTKDVGEKTAKEIEDLKKKGIKSLILDLRGNPGGQLTEAINISSLFLENGLILKTVNRQKEQETYSANGDYIFSGRLVVLVDSGSASASEIVAGALKDHKRAYVIGEKTFGKGVVQEVVMLSNGGAIIIPTQKWLTPNGTSISEKGIIPNKTVKNPDKQLAEAVDYLK